MSTNTQKNVIERGGHALVTHHRKIALEKISFDMIQTLPFALKHIFAIPSHAFMLITRDLTTEKESFCLFIRFICNNY